MKTHNYTKTYWPTLKIVLACLLMAAILVSMMACAMSDVSTTTERPDVTLPYTGTTAVTDPEWSEATDPIVVSEPEEASDVTQPTETEPVETEPVETAPVETEPVETTPVETEPAETEPVETEPAESETVAVVFKEANETVYAIGAVNVRTGPGTEYDKIGKLQYGESVTRIGIGDNGWSKVIFDGEEAYVSSNYLSTTKPVSLEYPLTYSDDTCTITIYKEWYENAWVYAAHLEFTDYTRLSTACANGKYNSGRETTSHAAKRLGAILAINGDYAVPSNGASGYCIARGGVVCNDKLVYSEGIYSSYNGILAYRTYNGCSGKQLSDMVAAGYITDTFQFGPAFLLDGKIIGDPNSNSRAQRTFIGTNGNAGDIWLCVSDGRYNDGKSAGLNGYQCAAYLASKGCTFGIPLDGGGSSTMYFNGQVLNAERNSERSVADFVYFK